MKRRDTANRTSSFLRSWSLIVTFVGCCLLIAGNLYAARNVSFTWTANNDDPAVDGYRLYYKTGDPGATLNDYAGTTNIDGENPSPVTITDQATSNYILENLADDVSYSFVLTAYRGSDESTPTTALTLAASTTTTETRSVSFTWTANSDDPEVDGYHLHYKLGDPGSTLTDYLGTTDATGGNASPVEITGQSSNSYTMANLLIDQKYSFVLTAYRGTVESEPTSAIVLEAGTQTQNTVPTATDASFTVDEDTSYSGQLTGNDADGDSLTYAIASNASQGTVSLTNSATGAFTYSPNAGINGSDSFTFRVNDGTIDSSTATVSITITPVNDAPTANSASLFVAEDSTYSGQLSGSDPDGDSLTFSIATNGSKGTALISDNTTGAFTYTPDTNTTGTDSFTFTVSDGTLSSASATISVSITGANDPPTANSGTFSTPEDTAYSALLSGNDPDGDSLTFSIAANGSKGTAVITDNATGAFTYTPEANCNGHRFLHLHSE